MQARMYLCLITINSQIHVYRANFHLAIAKVLVLLELFVSFVPSLLTWLITHACWIPHIWLNELFIELSIFHLGAAYEKYRGPLGNVRKGVLVSIFVTLQRHIWDLFFSPLVLFNVALCFIFVKVYMVGYVPLFCQECFHLKLVQPIFTLNIGTM